MSFDVPNASTGVQTLHVDFGDGTSQDFTLYDQPAGFQTVDLTHQYPGDAWQWGSDTTHDAGYGNPWVEKSVPYQVTATILETGIWDAAPIVHRTMQWQGGNWP